MRRRKAAFGRLQLRQRGLCARGAGLRGAAGLVGACVRLCLSCVPVGESCDRFALPCAPIGRSCVRSRLSLFLRQEKRNGLRYVAFLFLRRSGSPLVRSQRPYSYRALLVHFGLERFFAAIPTENEGTGERSRRRGVGAFCVIVLTLPCFPRGVRWGYAPQTAPRSH